MRAFVIKNKEGKYWCGNDIFSATIDIRKTYICEDFNFISKVINKLSSEGLLTDCEVVEITIAEGDLEQENKTLRRALELACGSIHKLNNTSKNIQPDFAEFYIADAKESMK